MSMENTILTRSVFKGKIINVRVDEVLIKEGVTTSREIVEHPGAAAIVALDDKKQIIMVKQFRKPIERELYEIPAGKLDPGETPLECAKRELYEETGFVAKSWKEIFSIYTSPGFSNEKIVIYFAECLTRHRQEPIDQLEISKVEFFSIDILRDMIFNKEIQDAKTIAGIMAVKSFYVL